MDCAVKFPPLHPEIEMSYKGLRTKVMKQKSLLTES